MVDALNHLETQGLAELREAGSAEALEAWRIKYLGTKGALKSAIAGLKDVPKADKPAVGARLNEVKTALEAAFEARKATVGGDEASDPGAVGRSWM